jgi:Putative transposase
VKVLGRLFRGKYLAALKGLYEAGELRFAGSTAALAEKPAFQAWLSGLYAKDWVVYAKKPFAGPDVLLKYLTRYTHRVALSNGRLKKVEGDRVTLSYKDYTDGCRAKEMTLTGPELLRRFALHVLPKGFVRVRQCGILAHRGRHERLALCRRLLGVPVPVPLPLPAARLVAPAPLSTEPSPGTDRAGAVPIERSMAENPSFPVSTPNTLPASSLPAVLLLMLALSCDGLGWLLACASSLPVVRRCPSCGQGELQTIWEQPRPRGRQRQTKNAWNTS